MEQRKIYKGDLLLAENTEIGWVVFVSRDIAWLKSYAKKNKKNIKDYSSLMSMIRSHEIDRLKERFFGEKND